MTDHYTEMYMGRIKAALGRSEEKILGALSSARSISAKEVFMNAKYDSPFQGIAVNHRDLKNALTRLVRWGTVRKSGRGKTTVYQLNN